MNNNTVHNKIMKRKDKEKDRKSKELLEAFKKGGRVGAKKDFMELLKRASNPLKK